MAFISLGSSFRLDRLQNRMASGGSGGSSPKWTLVVHGGAGTIDKGDPERERKYLRRIEIAMRAGTAILERKGGTALDAVEGNRVTHYFAFSLF